MAWYDYDRDYAGDRTRRYGGRSYDAGYGGFSAGYAAPRGYGAYGYGYDEGYSRRTSPERSPTYGRFGDQAIRRYVRRHGYDAGYTIRPDRSGGYGGYSVGRRNAGRGGYGMMEHRGWTEGSYDWGYRW